MPLPAETSLDDSTYDTHGAQPASLEAVAEEEQGEEAPSSSGSDVQQSNGAPQQRHAGPQADAAHGTAEQQPGGKATGFDRLVSRVMRDEEAGKANGIPGGPPPAPSASSRFRRGLSRGARRLTSGYLRRVVSARFGGKQADADEEEPSEKPVPEAGKSGEQ